LNYALYAYGNGVRLEIPQERINHAEFVVRITENFLDIALRAVFTPPTCVIVLWVGCPLLESRIVAEGVLLDIGRRAWAGLLAAKISASSSVSIGEILTVYSSRLVRQRRQVWQLKWWW
jgi:hypothetical protein